MKAVIKKDFITMGIWGIVYFIFPVLISVAILFDKFLFILLLIVFALAMEFPISILADDTKTRFNYYSDTLPISRKSVVTGKFLELMFMCIYCIAVSEICLIINNLIKGTELFNWNSIVIVSLALFLASLISVSIVIVTFGHRNLAVGFMASIMGGAGGYFGGNVPDNRSIFTFTIDFSKPVSEAYNFWQSWDFNKYLIIGSIAVIAVMWIIAVKKYKKIDL